MSGRGRGAYYKQKYGRGGNRGAGGPGRNEQNVSHSGPELKRSRTAVLGDASDLEAWLRRHDNRPYPAYHDIEGTWTFPGFTFTLDHAQADPYAAPSKAHVRIPHATAKFPASLYTSRIRKIALADYVLRALYDMCVTKRYNQHLSGGGWSGGKGGQLEVDRPGQQVLERTAVLVDDEGIEVRFLVGLPARGRSIMGAFAATVLCEHVSALVAAVYYAHHDATHLAAHVDAVEDQEALRAMLPAHGLVGFVPNGAVLARESGASDRPMTSPPAVRFESPESLQVTLELPNRGAITGMGIQKQAVYVCLGGGFHGKSTFLAALARGPYNHVPDDGRAFVSLVPSAVSVRSEDGRPVRSVDISPFIANLPDGSDTSAFTTSNASGSTSCAAGFMEALELGTDVVILDEDTTASNFLVRDAAMQALVPNEPITPLAVRARDVVEHTGLTMVLVCGSSSAFLSAADVVVQMDAYRMLDVTARASEVAQGVAACAPPRGASVFGGARAERAVGLASLAAHGKVATRGAFQVQWGDETLDLHAVPQLVTPSQTRAIEAVLRHWAHGRLAPGAGRVPLRALVDALEAHMDKHGVDVLQDYGRLDGFLARPRRVDVGAAGMYTQLTPVNRLRQAQWAQLGADA